jgi:hypothetical protein
MNAQRLRNLTTGKLHTKMEDIYADVEFITREKGVMTHMLPNAHRALQQWLKEKVSDQRYWDGAYDVTHAGEFDLQPMTDTEKQDFWNRYGQLPSPFEKLSTT